MRINWDTPVSELMHSDDEILSGDNIRYIDLDPDEMMHWKYIKREKLPNGKYRYYYDQSELDAAKKQAEQARTAQLRDSVNAGQAKYEFKKNDKNLKDKTSVGGKGATLADFKQWSAAKKTYEVAYAKAKTSEQRAREAVEKYEKMKVSTFVERTVSKAIVKVANFFSKLLGSNNKKTTSSKYVFGTRK